jgi:hypothetical protein
MDITVNELKIMKAKQLRRIIRETINTVMKEGVTYAGKDAVDDAQKDPKFGTLSGTGKTDTINKLKQGGTVTIGEGDIEEMARIAKGFRLADPEFDATPYANKRISGTSLADIINYFRENPGAEKTQLQTQFNFVRPQIANAVVNSLLDAGVLVKLGVGGAPEAPVEVPGEEQAQQATDPEDLFMGGAENPLSMYFDNVPNDNGEEDFNDEEEPTVDDLETSEPPTSSMSDEDYEAWMQYDTLKNRLDATKSNILRLKRGKSGGSDLEDKPSDELLRLRDLKASIQNRMDNLIQGSEYLKKKVEKETGKPVAFTTAVEPEEEETINEVFDDYDMRKRQYYAGIIK